VPGERRTDRGRLFSRKSDGNLFSRRAAEFLVSHPDLLTGRIVRSIGSHRNFQTVHIPRRNLVGLLAIQCKGTGMTRAEEIMSPPDRKSTEQPRCGQMELKARIGPSPNFSQPDTACRNILEAIPRIDDVVEHGDRDRGSVGRDRIAIQVEPYKSLLIFPGDFAGLAACSSALAACEVSDRERTGRPEWRGPSRSQSSALRSAKWTSTLRRGASGSVSFGGRVGSRPRTMAMRSYERILISGQDAVVANAMSRWERLRVGI
jgi:hypothetical protein